MATSQEYLREIATKVDSIYCGALRDAADRLDALESDKKQALRDSFAIAALPCATEILLNYDDDGSKALGTETALARMAYIIADAMLEVRHG